MNFPFDFSIHDFVVISIVFIVVNREEDDFTVDTFTFEDTCLKGEIPEYENKLATMAWDKAIEKEYDFVFDVIPVQKHVNPL